MKGGDCFCNVELLAEARFCPNVRSPISVVSNGYKYLHRELASGTLEINLADRPTLRPSIEP